MDIRSNQSSAALRSLTDEEKESLEYFAGLLYSDSDLAKILQMDAEDLRLQMKMQRGEAYDIITRARLIAESQIRKGIIDMAARGSTPAQTMAMELMQRMRKDNL